MSNHHSKRRRVKRRTVKGDQSKRKKSNKKLIIASGLVLSLLIIMISSALIVAQKEKAYYQKRLVLEQQLPNFLDKENEAFLSLDFTTENYRRYFEDYCAYPQSMNPLIEMAIRYRLEQERESTEFELKLGTIGFKDHNEKLINQCFDGDGEQQAVKGSQFNYTLPVKQGVTKEEIEVIEAYVIEKAIDDDWKLNMEKLLAILNVAVPKD